MEDKLYFSMNRGSIRILSFVSAPRLAPRIRSVGV